MNPKIASAVAAPTPDAKPASLLAKIVRRTHMTPTGPTGTAMTIPIAMPFSKKTKSIGCPTVRAGLCYSAPLQSFEPPEPAMTDTDDAYQFQFVSIDGER